MIVEDLKKILEQVPDDYKIAFEIVRDPENDVNCKDDILSCKDAYEIEWEFLKSHCMGCYTTLHKEKVLGLQIHY